jgi:hypothetical protein
MKTRKFFLFIIAISFFSCDKDENNGPIDATVADRWDLDQVIFNGTVLTDIDCELESYMVLNGDGTGEYFTYYDYGGSVPCDIDSVYNITWFDQTNSTDYTVEQLPSGSGNFSVNGNTLTLNDAYGTQVFSRH